MQIFNYRVVVILTWDSCGNNSRRMPIVRLFLSFIEPSWSANVMTSNSWKYNNIIALRNLLHYKSNIKHTNTHTHIYICLDSELSSMTRPYITPDIDMHSSDQK